MNVPSEQPRTRVIHLDPRCGEPLPVTKVQIKFTKAALEKLFAENVELETIISHQAVQTLMDRYSAQIRDRIADGLDLTGMHIAHVALNERIREMIRTEVGNYIRNEAIQLRAMIDDEVQRQLPGLLKSAVGVALQGAAKRVVEGT